MDRKGTRWSQKDETLIVTLFKKGLSFKEIGLEMGRSAKSIEYRLALISSRTNDPEGTAQGFGVSDAVFKKVMSTQAQQIYVLLLEKGKYYIGKTNNVQKRLKEHQSGNGSAWTKLYSVVELIETRPLSSQFDEDKVVKEYMSKYGLENVRGGSYSTIKLPEDEQKFLRKELRMSNDQCYKCNQRGHFGKNCPTQKCQRCGRNNHTVDKCYARTDLRGHPLRPAVQPAVQPVETKAPTPNSEEETSCIIC